MKKIAVILSGCGVYDGSEIHEATFGLLALAKNKCTYAVFAPNIEQHHVINHLNGKEMPEKRNVLVESARIARGNVKDLAELKVDDFDGLLLPGGFGAAKNLSNYAFQGKNLEVNETLSRVINDFHSRQKPITALCISPLILAKLISGAKLTIGTDEATASDVKNLGGIHKSRAKAKVVVDKSNKLVTTPCYMLSNIGLVALAKSINKAVKRMCELM